MDWTSLFASPLVDEGTISGLSGLQLLQEESPYRGSDGYFRRVEKAVEQLPQKHQDAALAMFSKVFYAPRGMVEATNGFFWQQIGSRAEESSGYRPSSLDDVHIFEVDPSGLMNEFVLANGLSRRLNHSVHSRLTNVGEVLEALQTLTGDPHSEQFAAAHDSLRTVANKGVWIILSDKVLSGQSLIKDIERICALRRAIAGEDAIPPAIYVCAQFVSSVAEESFSQFLETSHELDVILLSAVRLTDEMRVNSDRCSLFGSANTLLAVRELCQWFDHQIVSKDSSFNAVREQSGGSLQFGYRECGLLFVDYRNCPTNSIPLLWYSTDDVDAAFGSDAPTRAYHGPFPRVHSRRGPETTRAASMSWSSFNSEDAIRTIRTRLEVRDA